MSTDLVIPGSVTATSLTLPVSLPFEQWELAGEMLGRMGRASQWWLGDWLNHGEAIYGEKYSQAMDVTGYEYQTLADFAWVSRRVKVSVRNEKLSWKHHRLVAQLGSADQDRWLGAAVANGWSSGKLRAELNGADSDEEPEICPTCHRRLPKGSASFSEGSS